MLLLAADTSGKQGSIALAECEARESFAVIEVVPLAGGAFSAQLVPEIAALLKRHGRTKSDLGAFAVASGPGSFTGLRVGLAAIKALGEALQKPIAVISLLEAVACRGSASGHDQTRILAALDAGRGDVYVGDYELDLQVHAPVRMITERLLSGDEFIVEAREKIVITPDARLCEMIRSAGLHFEAVAYPDSAVIARLGWERLRRGETVRPEDLEANYIRHSDAEIFSKPTS